VSCSASRTRAISQAEQRNPVGPRIARGDDGGECGGEPFRAAVGGGAECGLYRAGRAGLAAHIDQSRSRPGCPAAPGGLLHVLGLGSDPHVAGIGAAAQPKITVMQNRHSRFKLSPGDHSGDLMRSHRPLPVVHGPDSE